MFLIFRKEKMKKRKKRGQISEMGNVEYVGHL